MRSIIVLAIFVILIGILFFSLFRQPIQANTTALRLQMRTAEIEKRQADYFERQLKRCRKDLYEEATNFVDSLVADINLNNDLDTFQRRFRPKARLQFDNSDSRVKLEPLFSDIDSLE